MKKIMMSAIALGLMAACKQQEEEALILPIEAQVEVTYGELFEHAPADGASVQFTHKQTGTSQSATTDEQGKVKVKLLAGVYDITAQQQLTPEQMEKLTGEQREGVFSGVMQQVSISPEHNTAWRLAMNTETIGSLIIKQVYYAGSDTQKGANYRDQFIEIHNNSTAEQPLAEVGIAIVHALGSTNSKNGVKDRRYDWASAPELQGKSGDANNDFVYAWNIYTFPRTAPLLPPGKSVIVAATALNHKAPLVIQTLGGEKRAEVPEPELTIDLSGAPYEIYNGHYINDAGTEITIDDWDQDNPLSANMNIRYATFSSRDLNLNNQGRLALALLMPISDQEKASYNTLAVPTVVKNREASKQKQLQIPMAKVIDGVNISNLEDNNVLGLPVGVDAGFTKVHGQHYSSESVIRKHREVRGRKVYQDTNNSSADFQVLPRPDVSSINP